MRQDVQTYATKGRHKMSASHAVERPLLTGSPIPVWSKQTRWVTWKTFSGFENSAPISSAMNCKEADRRARPV